jgi:hypothetical protein
MLPGETEQRRIVMLPSLHRWLHPQATKPSVVGYFANVRVHLGRFVKGEKIDNLDYMKELGPSGKGTWEFRINFFPKTRVFGVFAGQDLFFATHSRDRNDLDSRKWKWDHALNRIEREWDSLFPGLRWYVGTCFSDYVTINGDERRVGHL